jgi:putative ABC transport system permease protein
MLQLLDIKKDYYVGGRPVPALNGVTLQFQDSEFVAILGPSGCGKTTLLNIVGGLDRYTSGDLLVDGKSTKDFADNDWDSYRNATIGFVFQNYNLIAHLSVLDNVEMALRLSGVSAKERKERAERVLREVGLVDHLHKRPNQLSGGQMQRVAIARALVNNPKILLADEPTGALDSKTSHQIMALIQEIAKNRLVIMVTHNAELARQYSDRTVQLFDGLVIEDSMPMATSKVESTGKLLNKKTSMSYWTALKTSFKNLLTKKGRTIITAIAGSIGIVGIALVLAISTGMTAYVGEMQSDTLAGFPLTISRNVATDFFASRPNPMNPSEDIFQDDPEFPTANEIYAYNQSEATTIHTNNIDDAFLDYLDAMDTDLYNSISYSSSVALHIVAQTSAGGYIKVPTTTGGSMFFGSNSVFSEIPDNPEFIQSQYDVLAGMYPTQMNQLVLIVDEQNRLDTTLLEALGIDVQESYTFTDFLGSTFLVIPNNTFYIGVGNVFVPGTDYEAMATSADQLEVSIVGILRVKEDSSSSLLSTGVGYTTLLTEYLLEQSTDSAIVEAQIASPTTNVLTGLPFNPQLTYESVMRLIGGDATPTGIQIYPVSFDAKEAIKAYLDDFNVGKVEAATIIYSDLAETISRTVSELINTITVILAAFAGISLVVSSIMIGIITYVSVVERTKEIGIMRSLGARKKDISRIFNAETVLIGLAAGAFGIAFSLLINIPVNLVIANLIGVSGFSVLTLANAVGLIVLSTILTLIAGLIPSGIAARKDPVIALRTE